MQAVSVCYIPLGLSLETVAATLLLESTGDGSN